MSRPSSGTQPQRRPDRRGDARRSEAAARFAELQATVIDEPTARSPIATRAGGARRSEAVLAARGAVTDDAVVRCRAADRPRCARPKSSHPRRAIHLDAQVRLQQRSATSRQRAGPPRSDRRSSTDPAAARRGTPEAALFGIGLRWQAPVGLARARQTRRRPRRRSDARRGGRHRRRPRCSGSRGRDDPADAATRERIGPRSPSPRQLPTRPGTGAARAGALAAPVDEREAARAASRRRPEYRRIQTPSAETPTPPSATRSRPRRVRAGPRSRAAEARLVSVVGRRRSAATCRSWSSRSSRGRRRGAHRPALGAVPGPSCCRPRGGAGGCGPAPSRPRCWGPPDTDPTTQGRGFLLLIERPPWPPGTALTGWRSRVSQAGVDVCLAPRCFTRGAFLSLRADGRRHLRPAGGQLARPPGMAGSSRADSPRASGSSSPARSSSCPRELA